MRSENVPCGFSSTCTSPLSTSCSKSLFSPTYVEIIFLIWRFCRSSPRPAPSVPALLLAMVRFLVPLRRTASMRCSGTPHRPKPPTKMVAPSSSLAMAASAEAMRLSMKVAQGRDTESCPEEECTATGTRVVGGWGAVNRIPGDTPIFSDVWQGKDLQKVEFVCVAGKRVRGAFFVCVAAKGVNGERV